MDTVHQTEPECQEKPVMFHFSSLQLSFPFSSSSYQAAVAEWKKKSPFFILHQKHKVRLLKAPSNLTLNTSSHGPAITSKFQHLSTLTRNNFFLTQFILLEENSTRSVHTFTSWNIRIKLTMTALGEHDYAISHLQVFGLYQYLYNFYGGCQGISPLCRY